MRTVDPCPGAERLAAFAEGGLTGSEKDRIQRHLLICEECYAVVVETARMADVWTAARPRRTWAVSAAAAVAILGIAAAAWMGGSWWRAPSAPAPLSRLSGVLSAFGPTRLTEGRLSLTPTWAPSRELRRSGEDAKRRRARTMELAALAAQIETLAGEQASPENLHALGLAQLALGDLDEAVATLERAQTASPRDTRIGSDLAAALLERGLRHDRAEDIARSLSTSEEALELDAALPEARFNRALSLEALNVRRQALAAWQAYLEVDSTSPWADEARSRMEALRQPTPAQLWPRERDRLEKAARDGDVSSVREIVERFRQPAREWLRDEWLARWGAEARREDWTAAEHTLAQAGIVARCLSDLTGDPMSLDLVETLEAASAGGAGSNRYRTLARAHEALASGRHHLEAFRIEQARPLLDQARREFERVRSPARLWAVQGLSVADYYRGDYESAKRHLREAGTEAGGAGYLSLSGHVHWVEGLIQVARSRFTEALASYRRALEAFERVGDDGYAVFMKSCIVEDLRYLADREQEWRYRQDALTGLSKFVPEKRAEVVLMESAIATLEQDLPRAALHFNEECLATALARSDAVQVANALQWRALAHFRLGKRADAQSDLKQARSWSARIDDPHLRRRLESEMDYAGGLAASLEDSDEAQVELSRALDYFRDVGNDLRLSELYLARARVGIRRNALDAAARDYLSGIQVFERQRLSVVAVPQRISFFDTATDLFDEAIGLAVSRGDLEGALSLAERGRARQLLEALPVPSEPLAAAQIRARLPDTAAVILYAALPSRLLAWVVKRGGVDLVPIAVGAKELERILADLRQSIQDPGQADRVSAALSRLHEITIRPLSSRLSDVSTLIIVPDKALHAAPFSAFLDGDTQSYLIERHQIVVAPSASMFVRALERQRQMPPLAPSLVVVGDPSFDRTTYPDLPRLARASDEAMRIAPLYASSLILKREMATKAAFLDAASRYSVVHYAGHAISHETDPLRSRLILAPDPRTGDDGTLYAEEIYGRRFPRTRLVVLAACSTASGRISRGEGAMSLARPFLASGIPAVIASLWDIEDRSAREVSIRLHRRIAAGSAPQEALRAVQLELLASPEPALRSPSTWAAFEIIGGSLDGPLEERKGTP